VGHRRIVAAAESLLRSDLRGLPGSVTANSTGAGLGPHHDRKRQM
jgi:hypothetical protein